ncbi:hypothetical protein NicSoilC5_17420 [Arthrobacter sp. NicSoilC5]|nr:hypothetical protein NicSoilC5_17420 [Arthrobacter sp. NicSoilC5]
MGVDIVNHQTQPRSRSFARTARAGIISLGLAGLAALSYHSATAPETVSNLSGLHAAHSSAALASAQEAVPIPAGSQPATPLPSAGAAAATATPALPGPEDPADPANRPQTSLKEVASKEHAPAGAGPRPAPQGPPPVARGPVLPSQVFERGAQNAGGCLKEYGENGQCVPAVPPSLAQHLQDMRNAGANTAGMEHRWSCTELRHYFQNGVAVRQRGIDPQHLDTNGDGKACGPGD